jgi:ABC-2 type transport system permease protein
MSGKKKNIVPDQPVVLRREQTTCGSGIRYVIEGLRVVKQVVISEFSHLFSDFGILIFFIGVQIIYPIVYPIPFYHQHVRELPVAAVDFDNSALSRQLLRMADASETIHITEHSRSLDEAKKRFYSEEVRGVVVIPKDFSRNVQRGVRANVAVYTDASFFLVYKQVFTGFFQSISTLSAGIELKKLMAKGASRQQAVVMRDPVPLESVPLYNSNSGYGSYIVPVVLIIILQQTLLIGLGMLGGTIAERKSYHFMIPEFDNCHRIVPVILGKALTYFLFYSVHVFYFFGVLFKVYGYPHHASIFSIYLYFVPFLLSVIFLSIALSTFFRSRESSVMILLCTSIVFIMLSGFAWPSVSMPGWMRAFSLIIPSTSAIRGFLKLNMMDASFADVLFDWGMLWLLTLAYFVFSFTALRRIIKKKKKSPMFE